MSFLLYLGSSPQGPAPAGGPAPAIVGEAEYSYRFLHDAYRDMLAETETVIGIDRPELADRYHAHFAALGEPCTLLAFCPPNLAPVGLACPTVCLFAWEFTTLPTGGGTDDPRQDWRHVFLAHGRSIAMSTFAAEQVRMAMGDYCEVAAIPAPVYDGWADVEPRRISDGRPRILRLGANLVRDTRQTGIGQRAPFWPLRDAPIMPAPGVPPLTVPPAYVPDALLRPSQDIVFDGMVFTTVFAPKDGRKNWRDLVSAFIWAFRDIADATLVVKIIHRAPETFLPHFENLLFKCGPFACRVVAIGGWLDDGQMRDLASVTDIVVNTSHGEGMCLPLAEFMSAGVVAIAPAHTAMADYITTDNAFIVRGTREHNVWPHDPEQMFRTMRYRIEWDSIVEAFEDAAAMLGGPAERRMAMSNAARQTMRGYCSRARIGASLRAFLGAGAFAETSEAV